MFWLHPKKSHNGMRNSPGSSAAQSQEQDSLGNSNTRPEKDNFSDLLKKLKKSTTFIYPTQLGKKQNSKRCTALL